MKKVILFAAFAALALTSCVKEATRETAPRMQTVSFEATAPETKTLFGSPDGAKYPVFWTNNDQQVSVTLNYNSTFGQLDLTRSADNKTATFTSSVESGLSEYTFVAVSPAAALITVNATEKRLNVEIPAAQVSSASSPDEKAQVLYAESATFNEVPEKVDMPFHHITGYFHFVFTDYASVLGEAKVLSVSVTSTKDIAGRMFYIPSSGATSANAMFKTISASTSTLDNVWVGLAPADFSNETLSLVINTDKGTISKDIQLGASANLTSGKIAKLTVSLEGCSLKAPVRYNLVTASEQLHIGDKILIVAANNDVALSTTQNTNNRAQAGVTKGDGFILDPSDAVEVITLEEGLKPGEYALHASGEAGYLYAAYEESGSGNNMRTNQTLTPYGSWTISIADKQNGEDDDDATGFTENVATLLAKSSARGLMLYNKASSLFSSYMTTSSLLKSKVSYLHIYRLDKEADTTPRFKVSMPEANSEHVVSTSAAAKDLEVYVFGNAAWTASVSGTGASLSATSGSGNAILTLSIPENTSETATPAYTVTVSTTASVTPASYSFTVNQSAKPGEGGIKVGAVLWSESFAGGAANDTPSAYLAKATSTGTTVYDEGTVTYTQNGTSTKLYNDGLIYLNQTTYNTAAKRQATGANLMNLLVAKSGWWKIAGIPCKGVKKVQLKYYSNSVPNADRTVTTDTEGVTLGTVSSTDYTSDWDKKVIVITYDITFSDTFSGEAFNLQFNNTSTGSNIRVTDVTVTVTEV
jgi:hypothetical protein